MGFLIVFLGGGIGAALRHGVNLVSARLLGTGLNYATLFENVSGSVIMGLLVGYFAFQGGVPQHVRLFRQCIAAAARGISAPRWRMTLAARLCAAPAASAGRLPDRRAAI